MRESSGYQYILDEGQVEHAQRVVLRLGRKNLGAAGKAILDRMIDRVSEVASWDDLLETR